MFNSTPGADVILVAKKKGELRPDSKAFGIVVDHALSDVPHPDVFVVPGGIEGTFAAAADEETLAWVREAHAHATLSTSVCTGSLILGAAGLLTGKRATTHWAAQAMLEQYGATYTADRVVLEGDIVTAAGVSSGIDMALTAVARLFDEDTAKAVQLGIEYDPQPPFDTGSPQKAGARIQALAMQALGGG